MPPELLDCPAHLLFHSAHAQPRLFRDFRITIAIETTCEKYLPGQGFETQDRPLDTLKTITRLQGRERICVSDLDILNRHMLGLICSGSVACLITQKVLRRLPKIGARRFQGHGLGSRPGDQPREDLLDDVLRSICGSSAVEKAQQARPLGAIDIFQTGCRHGAVVDGRQWIAFVERNAGRA